MKGGTIIVGGDTGAFSGFMMQRGRMVVCGATRGRTSATRCTTEPSTSEARFATSAWTRCRASSPTSTRPWLTRKLRQYELLPDRGVDHFTKIVAGKQLWNYDNLEPTEKKLIL